MDKINAVVDFFYNLALILRNKRKHDIIEQVKLFTTYFSILFFKTSKYKNYKFFYENFSHFIGLFTHRFIRNDYFFNTSTRFPFIIDCGANIGDSVLYFKDLYPSSKILAFEPDKKTFYLLKKNTENNNLKGIKIFNIALSSLSGKTKFYFTEDDPTTGTMSLFPERGHKDFEIVMCDMLSKYITKKVDLLKLDVEGAETSILEEINKTGKIRFVDKIIMEYHHHLDRNRNNISKIFRLLERNGFKYQISTDLRPPFIDNLFQDILIYAYR